MEANVPRKSAGIRKSASRVCWDACAWIALISNEESKDERGAVERRGQMCRQVIVAAESGLVEIATSALNIVEVCKNPGLEAGRDNPALRDFFDHDFVLLFTLEREVGFKARDLMMSDLGLKPPDAIHLATAVVARATELHTFDRKLLNLDGKMNGLNGTPLKICKPNVPAGPAPLLDEANRDRDTNVTPR